MTYPMRRVLGKIPFLRSSYGFFLVFRQTIALGGGRSMARFMNGAFQKPDPWNYTQNTDEQQRFDIAFKVLQQAKPESKFESAFEIGCAEGIFTRRLACVCKRLVAADICTTAIERAQRRCAGAHAEFMIWDLRSSPIPENMELIVVMDVLELFFRPPDLRKAKEKLVSAMPSRGYLLLCNSRQIPSFEATRWSKWMIPGGKRIAEYFARDSRLKVMASETSDLCVTTLFQKK